MRSIDGKVVNAILTPGNFDERDSTMSLSLSISEDITLADLGYRGKDFSIALFEDTNVVIITRADTQDLLQKQLISRVRQPIESFFSLLWRRFIDRVFARSFTGLWTSIKLLLLFHNLSLAGVLS